MEQHDDSGSFAPDQHPHGFQAQANTISPVRRRWRAPAAATSMAFVAAVCLYSGSAAHATVTPKAAGVSAVSAQGVAAKGPLTPNATTASTGGVHGAFNVYDGPGGGFEFWFNPSTGVLTVAVGAGVGVGGGGVLGTYAPGTEPAAGTYLYASTTLAAGTVTSENVSGSYSLNNGVFSGSISTTVEGRTLTLNSNGTTSLNVSVVAAPGAVGWSASTGVKFVFDFNFTDAVDSIWDAIKDLLTGDYSLTDSDNTGDTTTVYSDDSSTDGSVVSSDGSSATSDDGSSADDSGSSSSDSSGGGGGGTSDDSDAPIMSE